MMNENLPSYIIDLLKPGAFPHPAGEVKLLQTHISYVLLAGDFAYKFKKPVDFGFLDFTTLAKRKQCCEQELLLNRRLAPTIYLGEVSVTESAGACSLNGQGQVVEYGIKMRRMPQEKMMGEVIRRGELTAGMIDDIIETLIPFYRQAAGGPEIEQYGTAEAVARNVLENFAQTEEFVGGPGLSVPQFAAISEYARGFLDQPEIFQQRIDAGRVRDCHGDLYSANICLADQVYIYDCIEFNRRFRYCDVASDVGFLAMDLDFHGLGGLSEYFVSRFSRESGDPGLVQVLNFYKCYRAYVRGKIGLFTAAAPEVDAVTRQTSEEQAARYFSLARQYAFIS